MSKSELIERANQALLAAEANGFSETAKALRSFLADVEQDSLRQSKMRYKEEQHIHRVSVLTGPFDETP